MEFQSYIIIYVNGVEMNEPVQVPSFEDRPTNTTSDEIIKRLVVDELFWDGRVDASKVKVVVNNGVVNLSGEVPTHADYYSAEADVRMIDNVVAVENELEVFHPALVPDNELRSNVETVLIWSPEVDSSNTNTVAKSGWITLTGTVKACKQKHIATELIETVPGVIGITNELTVILTERPADKKIADELIKGIEHHRDFNTDLIDVVVEEGEVTLEGTISNWFAYRTVEELALVTEGVVAVKNHLTFN